LPTRACSSLPAWIGKSCGRCAIRSRLPDPYILRVTFDYSNIPDGDARDLQAAAARVRSLVRMMTADIIEVGKELLHAKSKLKRGQFGDWLEAEFTMTERTAQNYMRAAERFGDKSEIVSLLQPSAVYMLAALSTPESATDDVIRRVERGEPMSPAAVRLVVNNAKFEQRSAQAKAKRALEEAKLSPRARKSREEKRRERERQRQDIERERAAASAAVVDLIALLRQKLGDDAGRFAELVKVIGWYSNLAELAEQLGKTLDGETR
jgi:DUF3102 family protein